MHAEISPSLCKKRLMSATDSLILVTFFRSGKTIAWVECGTLLDFAEANDIEINAGCRYGDCATCQTTLMEGSVSYLHETAVSPDEGTCLPCSCVPVSSITLDV